MLAPRACSGKLAAGSGARYFMAETGQMQRKIQTMSSRIKQLEGRSLVSIYSKWPY
jgi:hypothetical protein